MATCICIDPRRCGDGCWRLRQQMATEIIRVRGVGITAQYEMRRSGKRVAWLRAVRPN